MAYPVYSIGSETFISLRGEVALIQKRTETISRPNVPGVDVRVFETKGQTFVLESIGSKATYANCYAAYNTYLAMIGAGPQVLIKNGLNYSTTHSQKCIVLDVQLAFVKQIGVAAGNIDPSHFHMVSCVFKLLMEAN